MAMQIEKLNQYNDLEDDKLTSYVNYKQLWKLDSESSRNYCGPVIGVQNCWCKHNGITVVVANGNSINQIKEGSVPFDNIPDEVVDVQLFPITPNQLISARKLMKADNTIIFDMRESIEVNNISSKVIMQIKFEEYS